jgi:hypothetical protein
MQSPNMSISQLLQNLRGNSSLYIRRDAAIALGKLEESNEQAVIALLVAKSSDASDEVKKAALASLEAPIHQQYIKDHPDIFQKEKSWRTQEVARLQTEVSALLNRVLIAAAVGLIGLVGAYLVFANLGRMFYEGQGPVLIGMVMVIGSAIFITRTNAKEYVDLFNSKNKELASQKEVLAKSSDR